MPTTARINSRVHPACPADTCKIVVAVPSPDDSGWNGKPKPMNGVVCSDTLLSALFLCHFRGIQILGWQWQFKVE